MPGVLAAGAGGTYGAIPRTLCRDGRDALDYLTGERRRD